jgi:hypothetical protein
MSELGGRLLHQQHTVLITLLCLVVVAVEIPWVVVAVVVVT